MVAARANALKKPIRWFSIPAAVPVRAAAAGAPPRALPAQLRPNRRARPPGRRRGHRGGPRHHARARPHGARRPGRLSDRRLLTVLLGELGLDERHHPLAWQVLDKTGRGESGVLRGGCSRPDARGVVDRLERLGGIRAWPTSRPSFARSRWLPASRCSDHRGVGRDGPRRLLDLDLTIVRGLAYYTGTVFELFDAGYSLRAICGGGRYDNLLKALGGVDLPALGFGMGDVVLAELLREPRAGSRLPAPARRVPGRRD